MGSKNKKSGGKKKKTDGSKAPSESQPESGADAGTEMEQTETDKATVESVSSPSKKRKSGSDDRKEKLDALDETSSAAADKAGKGKKMKSGRDEGRAEELSSGALARQLRPRKQPKVFQDVTLEEADATRIIGRRIKVFWPLDDKWYAGHVKEFRAKTKQHHVVYDDGEEEWLVLKQERIKISVEHGEVFGKSVAAGTAVPFKVPPSVKEGQMEVDKGKKSGTSDGKKNGIKEKDSDGVVTNVKKTGSKRRQGSAVDNIEKNNEKSKKEVEGKAGSEDKEEENVVKSKLVEDKIDDGRRKEEDGGKAGEIKAEDQDAKQVDDVGDGSEKNEGEAKKENKDNVENEGQVQGQAAEDVKNAKKPKNSKKTAPRTKRGSGKQTQQKHISVDQMEDVDTEQEKVADTEGKQEIKRDEDVRVKENASLKEVNAPEVDSTVDDDGEKQQKTKESVASSRKKVDSSVSVGSDIGTADDAGAKHSNKDVRKQPDQADKQDEKNANVLIAEQSEEQPKVDVPKQANEDEPLRPVTIDQPDDKHSDARGSDVKAIENQVDIKDDDQLSKKPNKKYRVKVKSREPGKK
ncbi:sister chromatid cohesion protein PDS5 homolog C [Cryptomeria japonica]|uniref:sister chromatid cohesion protein PDS5 homolog C n=1 Tax=Cryptomeria japonica TaxID=3369 RepID=UPI0027DA7316|nr:sister chromatid cohesion protein PDS5 homolog C [Cryptomeria japonica]XP_057860288.2 sister chromatid cohesion protein PDS5 homolog C [Cryptomeria japonica]XP_057860289.2 sister chromatid cohesion protein PDS5 homolog C [Cryptomeria japonica]XP_057860290.2 sister chromatid cohesion protein PDS5 homolog C [Cryptomeria japonica]